MVQITYTVVLALAMTVIAAPAVPDPAGEKNIGNGKGVQFIGGTCLSSADCASACCAFNNNGGGICSGPGAQTQNGKSGCGFGDAGAVPNAGAGSGSGNAVNTGGNAGGATGGSGSGAAGSQNVGLANGSQFITGACTSDADCASTCCNAVTGLCAARAITEKSPGCGFTG